MDGTRSEPRDLDDHRSPWVTVIGPDEGRWLKAWMFCNHLKSMYTASLAVVTEHGSTEFMTGLGAAEPALRLMTVG